MPDKRLEHESLFVSRQENNRVLVLFPDTLSPLYSPAVASLSAASARITWTELAKSWKLVGVV